MTDTTVYDSVNIFADLAFIGGTKKILTFDAYDEYGLSPINLTGATITWRLCPYGEYTINTLEKSGSLVADYEGFTVTLDPADTEDLSGKYIQQIIIEDATGDIYKPGQGAVIIIPAIPT